jgi:predicted outer membrane protein
LNPDAKGLADDASVLGKINYAEGAVSSAMTPPTPTQTTALRQAREALAKFLTDFDRFYAEDVAAFRKQAGEGGFQLLAPEAPLGAAKKG